MSDGGKGDKRRPELTPGRYHEGYEKIWEREKDEFATHIEFEKTNEMANEVRVAEKDNAI